MLSYFANPHRFMALSKWLLPVLTILGVVTLLAGWFWAVFLLPVEEEMGRTTSIMYVHVPAAWVSMMAYGMMAGASLVYLIWRHSLADVAAKSAAPAAAAFAFLCLVTGSLWGRPAWGTYWVWDARLTAMLFQLFLVLGYMALRAAYARETQAAQASAILCLVGAINLPIIKYSVDWWNSLHQPSSVFASKTKALQACLDRYGPDAADTCQQVAEATGLAPVYLWPLLFNALAASLVFGALLLAGMRTEVMTRQYETRLARLNRGSGT